MALCLTLRPGEQVGVGNVMIEIIRVHRGDVRLSFSAPPEVAILRANAKHRTPAAGQPRATEPAEPA